MRKNRRMAALITAGLLALTPCASFSMMSADAAGTATLTITDSDKQAHDYNAYQIIKGTITNGELSGMSWGDNIDSTALVTALNTAANQAALGISGTVGSSVDDVAKVLAGIDKTDTEKIQKLAKIIDGCKTGTAIEMTKTDSTDYSSFTASNLDAGWYLILDETSTLVTGDETTGVRVKSADILKLTGDTTINSKHSLPTLEKKIVEGSAEVDANSAAIGDVVTYHINTKVPDMTGYDKYYFVIDDILSPGLTYNPDSISITIEDLDGPLTKDGDGIYTNYAEDGADYYVTSQDATSPDTGTAIKVVFENFKANMNAKHVAAGKNIQITYTATLDNDAVIGDAGNPNKAKLTYSNNPNPTGAGTPDDDTPDEPPTSNSPTGETPWDDVTTYSTAIKINKVDDAGAFLKGAVFTLTSTNFNEVKVVSGYKFAADDDTSDANTYYKLKDGSYTKTAPEGEYTAASLYDAAAYNTAFKKVYLSSGDGDNQTIIEKASSASYAVEAQVDENGVIRFEGLKPGTYTLHEVTPPTGYNVAPDVEIIITATNNTTSDVLNAPSDWNCSGANYVDDDNAFSLNVVNRYGATLPSTGGIGTKLFYLFGGMLAVGSGIVLVTKKRMSYNEK